MAHASMARVALVSPLSALCRPRASYFAPSSLLIFRSLSDYSAVVAGSGPAGLAVVGNILENKPQGKVLWVDPRHTAGKLDKQWREVPSNTKVGLFVQYGRALEPFRQVIEKTPRPNAVSALEDLEQEKGCQISYAADMCVMLSKGLREMDQVGAQEGKVTGADWSSKSSRWTVELKASDSATTETVSSQRLVLCTGALPKELPIPVSGLKMHKVDLDTALTPSVLASTLPKDSPATVAVVGGSHSAILVLLNLYDLARTTHPQLRVRWFPRSSLLYAEYKDGWILYDNTGLKGEAAVFARENLEDDRLPTSPVGKVVQKVDCSNGNGDKVYSEHLPSCTHIIYATGFAPNPLPLLTRDGDPVGGLQYDHLGGTFLDGRGEQLPGLFGAGIAFPERVKDPAGNVELAVGMFKFMKYLKRVVPQWIA